MAALLRHGFLTSRSLQISHGARARFATKAEKRRGIDRKVGPKIDSSAESVAAKGFLRPQKEYTPPADVQKRINTIYEKITTKKVDLSARIDNLNTKYQLLTACYNEFQHNVPNSLLYSITTLEQLIQFYVTPVSTITPYENLKNLDLPRNIHVQQDYHRFNPKTDTKFGGITAFPRSSTIVSGLKYKEKYEGHKQPELDEWPFLEK